MSIRIEQESKRKQMRIQTPLGLVDIPGHIMSLLLKGEEMVGACFEPHSTISTETKDAATLLVTSRGRVIRLSNGQLVRSKEINITEKMMEKLVPNINKTRLPDAYGGYQPGNHTWIINKLELRFAKGLDDFRFECFEEKKKASESKRAAKKLRRRSRRRQGDGVGEERKVSIEKKYIPEAADCDLELAMAASASLHEFKEQKGGGGAEDNLALARMRRNGLSIFESVAMDNLALALAESASISDVQEQKEGKSDAAADLPLELTISRSLYETDAEKEEIEAMRVFHAEQLSKPKSENQEQEEDVVEF